MKQYEDHYFNARSKYYPNGTIKNAIFNRAIFNPDKYKQIGESKIIKTKGKYKMLRVRDDSRKRAKDMIFDIAMMNEWEHMITLTLNKEMIDRYDAKTVGKKVRKWLNNMQQQRGLKYLVVPELHLDGAIHFHGLVAGNLNYRDSGHKDESGRTVYNVRSYKLGFSTAVQIDENKLAVAKYITKYITKDMNKIMGSFYFSGNVVRDVPCDYANIDYNSIEAQEYVIPEAHLKVKYQTIGLL